MNIDLGRAGRSLLRREFQTSHTTVIEALKGNTNSYLARKIRERAKEILIEETEKIKV